MKKFYILFLAIVTAFSCCCTSCSSDDDGFVSNADLPEAILGTWECVESEYDLNLSTHGEYLLHRENHTKGDRYIFYINKVHISSSHYNYYSTKEYKVIKDKLYLPFGDFKITIKGKTMTLTADKTDIANEKNVRMVFNKTKEYE